GGVSLCFFFFSSRRRHTRFSRDWSSDVCSSDLSRKWPRLVSPNAEPAAPTTGSAKLPWRTASGRGISDGPRPPPPANQERIVTRSEERRVGKEWRARWRRDHENKKKEERRHAVY